VRERLIDVPVVHGMSVERAARVLRSVGLAVSERPEPTATMAPGVVLTQDPPGGNRVPVGHPVTLTVTEPGE
jgi:beta-lactam-binding protein with PASTA domain